MAQTLDEEWTQARGMEVFAVGMDVSYTEDSQELINMRNKGAMLSDAAVQQGYVAANISEGLKDAGSNANGAMAGFMGMGIGMNAGGNIMGGYQQNPQYRQQQPTQPQQQAQPQQTPAPQAGGAAARLMDLLMRCGKHRQVLLGVRFKESPRLPKSVSAQTADMSFLQMQSSVPSAVQRQNNLNFKYKQSLFSNGVGCFRI